MDDVDAVAVAAASLAGSGESVEWGATAKKQKFSAASRREEAEEEVESEEEVQEEGDEDDVWGEWGDGFEVQGDTEADCAAWADLGECVKNEVFMVAHCAESCYHQHLIRSAVLTGKPFEVTCDTTVGPFTIELHPR